MPGISPGKDLPRLVYHRRALSNELLLRAVTGTSFFTILNGAKDNKLVYVRGSSE